ncbi:MAG TPA: PAS domain-containing protein [Candidatus Dormibacteraeota bacterium]|nr:PAS domain-containing protein [Candidatus Dormibacteraeota bacterium]
MFRALVMEGAAPRLAQVVRDEAMVHGLRIPGLLSFQPAVRETEAGTELVIVSTWSGFDQIAAAGPDLDAPLTIPGAASMLAGSRAEHYELVIGEARAMPLREAKLRLIRIPIRVNAEAAYYVAVRTWAEELLDTTGLVAFSLGRRVVGRGDQILAAMLWEDEAALVDAVGSDLDKPMGAAELSQFWAADPAIEHFNALTVVEPRRDAPAILLADDDRRYVHATPAASRLTERPLARLLTMRVEDIAPPAQRASVAEAWRAFLTEGSMEGPFTLARPDGTTVEVLYAAKANAPWPGVHASLLAPLGEGSEGAPELDIDRALIEAGLVARYSPPESA